RAALEHANQRIVEESAKLLPAADRRPGSTAVVLMVDDRYAYWAHIGDSRLYRVRRKRLALLTLDHTEPGNRYRDEPVIPLDLPHTNVLLAALGVGALEVRTGSDPLEAGDMFLLCSDGVSGSVDAVFIDHVLNTAPSAASAAQELITGALEAGGRDNASAIVV